MSPVFADTFYFLTLLNSKDAAHTQAWEFSKSRHPLLVTTISSKPALSPC